MEYKIALAGNPNCGKTTMFNDLTGSSQYVGNWPGVTVEKKEGKLRTNKQAIIPGPAGHLFPFPYTLEEVVTRNYLVGEHPDAMINIVDASNLERNLYLTTQLLEIGVPDGHCSEYDGFGAQKRRPDRPEKIVGAAGLSHHPNQRCQRRRQQRGRTGCPFVGTKQSSSSGSPCL